MAAGAFLLLIPGGGAEAAPAEFPAGSVVDVGRYGASGSDGNDDTEALRMAIRDNLFRNIKLFLPRGVYLISDTLTWRDKAGNWSSGLTLIGEGMDLTRIKLRDSCPGYGDSARPRAMVFTASIETHPGSSRDGEGNNAFRNSIRRLTLDIGRGNPGAVGVDFLGNNLGGIQDVAIVSGDGSGVAGLSMRRAWPGPAFFRNLEIRGFDYGIWVGRQDLSLTFEHLSLEGQGKAGIRNDDNVLSIRRLRSRNRVPALLSTTSVGMVVLVDCELGGAPPGEYVIRNEGSLFVRNLSTDGHGAWILDRGRRTLLPPVNEFTSHPACSLFVSPAASLGLPVEETPEYEDRDSLSWASVADFGANPNDGLDDVEGIRKALASAKTTVYFPPGEYHAGSTVAVRGRVRRIVAAGARIIPGTAFRNAGNPLALFRMESRDQVVLEDLTVSRWLDSTPGLVAFEHASSGTWVLKGVLVWDKDISAAYRARPGAGKLFLEDVSCQINALGWTFARGQKVWARQFNVEGFKTKIVNDGASLWILGLKTERASTAIDTRRGGMTELLGGFLYPTNEGFLDMPGHPAPDRDMPAFINRGSKVSLSYAVNVYNQAHGAYSILLEETRGGRTRKLRNGDVPGRFGGALVPLYVGREPPP